jgi:hypothetical protein
MTNEPLRSGHSVAIFFGEPKISAAAWPRTSVLLSGVDAFVRYSYRLSLS